jgi:hypothetical protein
MSARRRVFRFAGDEAALVETVSTQGRVDEFDPAEASGEGDDSAKIPFGIFAAERNPFEAFEPPDASFDA